MRIPTYYLWKKMSPLESSVVKGVAIVFIVLHNYLHWVSPSPEENEFRFKSHNAQELITQLQTQPSDSYRILFSYYGHYAVHIFFFLTGYAFMMKHREQSPHYFNFQKRRWKALYPAIIAAAIGYFIYDGFRLGWAHTFQTEGLNLIRQATGISNFIPDNIYHPIGPWWFIGVILQAYLLLPLLIKWTQRHGVKIIYVTIILSYLCQYFIRDYTDQQFDLNLYHTILGHLDVLGLGMLFAYSGTFKIPIWGIALAIIIFFISSLSAPLWKFSDLIFLIALLPLLRQIKATGSLGRVLTFLGGLSMYLFLCNGYLRRPLINIATDTPHWLTSIWSSLLFLALVILWSLALRYIVNKFSKVSN